MKNPLEPSEHDIQSTILAYLDIQGHFTWRQNTGTMKLEYKGKSRFFRAGFKGVADIIGIHKSNGRFIAIEVKKRPNKPNVNQLEFLNMIANRGGYALVAYSLEDVQKAGL